MWTQDEWFILSSLGVILTLCFVGNRGKITNTQNVCIVISLNRILSDWRISERWTHVERFVNSKVELNEAYSPNEHTKKARNKKVKRFRDCTIQCLNNMYNGGFRYWKKYIYKKAWIFYHGKSEQRCRRCMHDSATYDKCMNKNIIDYIW